MRRLRGESADFRKKERVLGRNPSRGQKRAEQGGSRKYSLWESSLREKRQSANEKTVEKELFTREPGKRGKQR